MKHLKIETNLKNFLIGAVAFFSVGFLITVVVPPLVAPEWGKALATMSPLTEEEQRGRRIFIAEGCTGCHTQQVRHLEPDMKRFGWRGVDAPPSESPEFALDNPHQLGTRRVGPDLSRVGGKYDSSWHYAHLIDPRAMTAGSVMPSYRYLKPEELRAVTAYLQTLGRGADWRNGRADYEQ
ncbi:MAG: cbb3-type cytochrome c oxidase subunit II [Planctomycetota bacterium]